MMKLDFTKSGLTKGLVLLGLPKQIELDIEIPEGASVRYDALAAEWANWREVSSFVLGLYGDTRSNLLVLCWPVDRNGNLVFADVGAHADAVMHVTVHGEFHVSKYRHGSKDELCDRMFVDDGWRKIHWSTMPPEGEDLEYRRKLGNSAGIYVGQWNDERGENRGMWNNGKKVTDVTYWRVHA